MVIDDWGLSPITVNGARELLDIIDDRVGTSSLVIASQIPLSSWYQTMDEPTVADAILDRVVHNAIKVELLGESMRKAAGQGLVESLARPTWRGALMTTETAEPGKRDCT